MPTKPTKFPYFGAGEAQYFEWIEVDVRFINKPTPTEIKKIVASAPKPIKPRSDDFYGRMLMAGSDQFGNVDIGVTYGNLKDGEKKARGKRFYFASATPTKKFNADIERWLLEINEFCPIQFAYRREDHEADGTVFSGWHKESVKGAKKLIDAIAKDHSTFKQVAKEKSNFKYALSGIFEYAHIKTKDVPENLINYLFPEKALVASLKHGDTKAVREFLLEHVSGDDFCEATREWMGDVDDTDKNHDVELLALAKVILSSKKLTDEYFAAGDSFDAVVRALFQQKKRDAGLMKDIKSVISNSGYACKYVAQLGSVAYGLDRGISDFKIGRDIYRFALGIDVKKEKCQALEIYCSALRIMQKDNTGLAVNPQANRWFLERCLPYAPQNPTIYFNAACLYVEMKEFDKAIECIVNAKKHKYVGYDAMIASMKKDKMFSEFRKYPAFVELVKG